MIFGNIFKKRRGLPQIFRSKTQLFSIRAIEYPADGIFWYSVFGNIRFHQIFEYSGWPNLFDYALRSEPVVLVGQAGVILIEVIVGHSGAVTYSYIGFLGLLACHLRVLVGYSGVVKTCTILCYQYYTMHAGYTKIRTRTPIITQREWIPAWKLD